MRGEMKMADIAAPYIIALRVGEVFRSSEIADRAGVSQKKVGEALLALSRDEGDGKAGGEGDGDGQFRDIHRIVLLDIFSSLTRTSAAPVSRISCC
jgi:hypothetical protein